MVTRIGGSRRKTRSRLKKSKREKGKININKYFQEFKKGDVVCLKAEPGVQKALYFRRFHGRMGKIICKRGKCYEIAFNDQGKLKNIITHPIHLRKQ
ncbi:MAG: 50S ribosomal protein L21e [Nanoarchaeota archaeon]|nr:50S ribosomal protein L21e [Nanoarchaeota archaeon]